MAAEPQKWNPKPFNPNYEHIDRNEVCRMTHLTIQYFYNLIGKGEAPAPSKLSPAISVWRKKDIEQFILDRARKFGYDIELDEAK